MHSEGTYISYHANSSLCNLLHIGIMAPSRMLKKELFKNSFSVTMSLNNSTAPLGQRKPEGMGTGEDVTSSSLRPQKMCGQPCRFPQSCSTKQGCSLNTSTHPKKK